MFSCSGYAHRFVAPWTWPQVVVAAAAVTAFVLLTIFAAGGVRGTDQYWYVADAESLLSKGAVQTNDVYPLVLLRDQDVPRPFIHNILPVYAAAAVGWGMGGPYGGWIVLNLLCSLSAALFIYLTVRHCGSHESAFLAGLLYLVMPAVFWQTTQPLAEAFIASLVAGAAAAFIYMDRSLSRWLGLGGLAALLYASRPTFVILLALLPVAAAYSASSKAAAVRRAIPVAVLCFTIWIASPHLLPPYLNYGYIEAINGAAAGDLLFSEPPKASMQV